MDESCRKVGDAVLSGIAVIFPLDGRGEADDEVPGEPDVEFLHIVELEHLEDLTRSRGACNFMALLLFGGLRNRM